MKAGDVMEEGAAKCRALGEARRLIKEAQEEGDAQIVGSPVLVATSSEMKRRWTQGDVRSEIDFSRSDYWLVGDLGGIKGVNQEQLAQWILLNLREGEAL